MTQTRSAEATIKGFNYQFAATIRVILDADPTDKITVEGIEDIDVSHSSGTDAIQCKYYEGTKLTNSVLRDILEPMLHDFSSRPNKITYYIYGHFKEKADFRLTDASRFKSEILGYKTGKGKDEIVGNLADDLKLTTANLSEFLTLLKFRHTSKYEPHREEVVNALQAAFNCSPEEAKHFFYPYAFSLVSELATKGSLADRTITRSDFLSRFSSKQLVFRHWLLREKDQTTFCRSMKRSFFTQANISPFARFFVIECGENETVPSLKHIATTLQRNWSSHTKGQRLSSKGRYAPYIYFRNLAPDRLVELLHELSSEGVCLVDGYPFRKASFSLKHLAQQQTYENQLSLRFFHDETELNTTISSLNDQTKEMFEFYRTKALPLNNSVRHVQIPIDDIGLVAKIV